MTHINKFMVSSANYIINFFYNYIPHNKIVNNTKNKLYSPTPKTAQHSENQPINSQTKTGSSLQPITSFTNK